MANHIELHPELRRRGRLLQRFTPNLGARGLRWVYRLCTLLRGRHSGRLRYEQVHIPRKDGTKLRLCVYAPLAPLAPPQGAPGLLWIHGGGYSVGAPEQDEAAYIQRFIAWGAGVVAAPDYTKSVVKPYPAALEDCCAALLWLRENGGRYGMRPDQVFIGGSSAGGGLTAALSLYARDAGIPVAFQMPLYPMLDDRPTPSNTGNTAPLWNSKSNALGWRLYLGGLYGQPQVPAYAAPARAETWAGLPPTCTFVGDIEPFFDETTAYADNLRRNGIPVHFKIFPGCFHAFDLVCPNTQVAKEAADFLEEAFRYAVGHYFAPGNSL